jgi:hypothetical protein
MLTKQSDQSASIKTKHLIKKLTSTKAFLRFDVCIVFMQKMACDHLGLAMFKVIRLDIGWCTYIKKHIATTK